VAANISAVDGIIALTAGSVMQNMKLWTLHAYLAEC
jgi:hypothetical protein